ncbi:hypothetical protein FIBSPDRAFT_899587 [Athelia psychrophila]|uniref:Ubiquitin-like domain-containing protein n=1 Tax=Athelia psychrophila TaxID=1759441 RepID=A0A165ZIF0_9AGAM|nr:hypothetical protein FIBSPDRAFT_899587 [Fibularhizoctonia sp. CBS 109695]
MQTTNTIHITVRTFTGKSFPIDVDPTHTVGEFKALIEAAGGGKSTEVRGLEYKGHELRDSRRFDHYRLATNDVLHIMPLSKVPKIALELVREDGSVFDITVSSGITVAKLKEEIKIEEKTPVRQLQLKLVNNQEDEDREKVITLQDDKPISEYSLEGQKVLVNSEHRCLIAWSTPVDRSIVFKAASDTSAIDIHVSIDGRIEGAEGNRIEAAVRLDQTLGSFKEVLFNKHSFHRAEHSLIFNGLELKDDEQMLGDLGFVEGCTVDAVATVQLSVATLAGKIYNFSLKATTLISEIRELLREVDADNQDDYAFSLDKWAAALLPSPSDTSASLPISMNTWARNSMTRSLLTTVRVSTTSERKF